MSTMAQPPDGYVPCSENCGRWTYSGKCWTCCALADGRPNDVYQSPDSPDWAPSIAARDAEHRAELAAAQRTIEQLGKDAAAIAEKLDRAVELLRKHFSACPWCLTETDKHYGFCPRETFLRELAPPPAESTPGPPAPPDDIRERLRQCDEWNETNARAIVRLNERLAAVEAKGEPGTPKHYFSNDGKKRCEVCALPEDRPCHMKGAKP